MIGDREVMVKAIAAKRKRSHWFLQRVLPWVVLFAKNSGLVSLVVFIRAWWNNAMNRF